MTDEAVPVAVSSAVMKKVLPLSFLETQLYERMSKLLESYLPVADIRFMLSEIKEDLFAGFTSFDSKQLHTLIHHCVKCPNVQRPPVSPSWNCVDPDLLIIVENPMVIETYGEFLFKGLKTAGFSSNRCMLTYVSRCKASQITQEQINNCIPYLHTELAVINPKLVLTLGLNCFQSLTNDTLSKLNTIRGLIRSWGTYQVLPEVSLGSLSYANEKGHGGYDNFVSSLQKAYSYLYPEG